MLTALLVAGLALRVVTQLAYRPALLYIDSYKYLSHAYGYDPVGYRILLDPVLWVGNLAWVPAVQHVLGLAMAVTLYILLIRRRIPRWAAALATAPVLLDAYQLQMEQTIMPDVLFEALILAGLAILLWNPQPRLRTIALGVLVLGASADVRQIGEALIVPAAIFAVLMTRGGRRRLGHLAVAAVCFCLPVVAYMSVAGLTGGGFALTTRSTDIFYGRAAVAANCAALSLPASERSLCPSPSVAAAGIDVIINAGDGPYQSYKPAPGQTLEQATKNFELSVLRQQPLAIPLSVARDAIRLFALTRDGTSSITPISRWQFQTTYPFYPPGVTDQVVAQAGQMYGGGGPVTVRPLAVFLRDYQLYGGYTPGPLLAAMTLAGAVGSLAAFGRRGGVRDPRRPRAGPRPATGRSQRRRRWSPCPRWPWWAARTSTSSRGATSFPRLCCCPWPARWGQRPSPAGSGGPGRSLPGPETSPAAPNPPSGVPEHPSEPDAAPGAGHASAGYWHTVPLRGADRLTR
jgi:hypothetical protein